MKSGARFGHACSDLLVSGKLKSSECSACEWRVGGWKTGGSGTGQREIQLCEQEQITSSMNLRDGLAVIAAAAERVVKQRAAACPRRVGAEDMARHMCLV